MVFYVKNYLYRLVNPFNNKIGSPASGFGRTGQLGIETFFQSQNQYFVKNTIHILGFVTYTDVCSFDRSNIFAIKVFDSVTCSPYIYGGLEWISYEDERSIKCKTNYVIDGDFGGVMMFSLNTDDFSSSCYYGKHDRNTIFPLTSAIRDLLFK